MNEWQWYELSNNQLQNNLFDVCNFHHLKKSATALVPTVTTQFISYGRAFEFDRMHIQNLKHATILYIMGTQLSYRETLWDS